MPFLSFLPAIKCFGHFQNPDTLVVDIHLLFALDSANLPSATVSLQVVIGLCKRKETAVLRQI